MTDQPIDYTKELERHQDLTDQDIWELVKATYELDETGDANLFEYLSEDPEYLIDLPCRVFLLRFLIWANGTEFTDLFWPG